MKHQKLKWRRIFLLGCDNGCVWTAEIGFLIGFGPCLVLPDGELRISRFVCPVCECKTVHGLPLTGPRSEKDDSEGLQPRTGVRYPIYRRSDVLSEDSDGTEGAGG